jgi:LysM repeat protein
MKVSVIAGLIVGIHVVVVASVAMQGCTVTRGPRAEGERTQAVEPPPPPTMPPSETVVAPVTLPAEPAAPVVTHLPPPPPPSQPAPAAPAANVYVVKSGDVLSKIAAAHGCRTSDLKELNGIKDANKIVVGQKLLLPDGSKPSTSQPAAKAAAPAAAKAGEGEYIVKSGDALSKIAAAHGCKTKDLMELNGIKDANKIRIGQKLKLPGAAPAAPAPAAEAAAPAEPAKADWVAPLAPAAEPVEEAPAAAAAPVPAVPAVPAAPEPETMDMEDVLDYTVQSGDTVESIARLFVVSSADILRINKMQAGEELKPGTVIRIPPTGL